MSSLLALIRKEEDEVLFAIAEELGKIHVLIENKILLLPLLEALCSVDETVVREQAVKSLSKIVDTLPPIDVQNMYAPMVLLCHSLFRYYDFRLLKPSLHAFLQLC